jgi:hypothetical protein
VIISCTGGIMRSEDEASFLNAGSDAVWGKPFPSHMDGSMQTEIARLIRPRARGCPTPSKYGCKRG